MVMPRSRSRSFESITRSCTCSCAAKVPDCCRSLSTSVVLPWSTWAMMATLRRDSIMGDSSGAFVVRGPALYANKGLLLHRTIGEEIKFAPFPVIKTHQSERFAHGQGIAFEDRGRDGRQGQGNSCRRRVERHLRKALQ